MQALDSSFAAGLGAVLLGTAMHALVYVLQERESAARDAKLAPRNLASRKDPMLAMLFSIMIATAGAECKWGSMGDIHTVPVHGYTWWSCGPVDGTKTWGVKGSIRSPVGDTYAFRVGQDGSNTPAPAHNYLNWNGQDENVHSFDYWP